MLNFDDKQIFFGSTVYPIMTKPQKIQISQELHQRLAEW